MKVCTTSSRHHTCPRCHQINTADLTPAELQKLKTKKFCNCINEESRYHVPDEPHMRSRCSAPDLVSWDPLFDPSLAGVVR